MTKQEWRDFLEERQVAIYFSTVLLGAAAGALIPGTDALESTINPALALMLFVTFLQVPLGALGAALRNVRFLACLLTVNFVVVPLLVFGLLQFVPPDPLLRLGVLIVLLCPCIDYVVTFSHLGKSDSKLLLAATPVLLIVQMIMLPIYLGAFLGHDAVSLVQPGPFLHAFVWLIALPLVLAATCQIWASRNPWGQSIVSGLVLLPVPATSLVLFVVIASVLPQLGAASGAAVRVLPVYVAFSIIAPLLGWSTSRMFGLKVEAGRSIAFSAATRNSLVVLPLGLAVPGAVPILPAVIVAQTLVELLASIFYMKLAPHLGRSARPD
ncbi:arsenic resistance protein [Tardiphaga alba]|uniref:Arsenic resistance protein n=1 Tax=Tardiphaga alba TaxID=340268 RepID=A0ABX8A2R7_9BRAD|nr:arsenic resistance protein [Tardiphaga alba]QUS37838.1 arsenic resistance protein [Tardiphaga alba]